MDILDQSLSNVTLRTKWDIGDKLHFWDKTWQVMAMYPEADELDLMNQKGHYQTFDRKFLELVRSGQID